MIDRIRQGLNYIYGTYNEKDDILAKKVLSKKEYEVFMTMNNYDRVHSIEVLKMVLEDDLIGRLKNYQKLALLHDCGKEGAGLLRRIKKVLVGDRILEEHDHSSYKILIKINPEVAKLAKVHHGNKVSKQMKRFQWIDDHC